MVSEALACSAAEREAPSRARRERCNKRHFWAQGIVRLSLLWLWLCFAGTAQAEVSAIDDLGETVRLPAPAARIVSLAPHATEMLFAAGLGARIVGAVSYSDFPPEAKAIPRVGRYDRLDLEAILALRPDLIVAWASGNAPEQIAALRRLGLAIYVSEPRELEAIPQNVERLGILGDTEAIAKEAATTFRATLAALQARYGGGAPVTLFYQIWNRPLMTVSDEHLISRVMDLCGGKNVFARLPTLAGQVDLEAVLAADPEVVLASGMGEARPDWLDDWRRWPNLHATRQGNLFFIPPDLIQRHNPRILEGAAQLCAHLEEARGKRQERGEK